MSRFEAWARRKPEQPQPVSIDDLTLDVLEEREARGLSRTSTDDDGAEGDLPCPWCGATHGDVFEMSEGGGHECGECGGEYDVEREVYATTRASRGNKLPRFLCREYDDAEECEAESTAEATAALAPAPGLAAAPCGPAPGPVGLVCAGAFFQPQPPEAPLWNGEPAPATWDGFAWPAWVPASVRDHIEGRAARSFRNGGPAEWLAEAERHGMPALGAWLTLPRERGYSGDPSSHSVLDTITGRFVPSPTNGCQAGYLVHRDGRATFTSSIPTNPAPWVQERGFRHRPTPKGGAR